MSRRLRPYSHATTDYFQDHMCTHRPATSLSNRCLSASLSSFSSSHTTRPSTSMSQHQHQRPGTSLSYISSNSFGLRWGVQNGDINRRVVVLDSLARSRSSGGIASGSLQAHNNAVFFDPEDEKVKTAKNFKGIKARRRFKSPIMPESSWVSPVVSKGERQMRSKADEICPDGLTDGLREGWVQEQGLVVSSTAAPLSKDLSQDGLG